MFFPCRSAFPSLPLLIGFATLFSRRDDGKFMLTAEVIAQTADVVIGLFAVVIFLVVYVISGAENDMVVDMSPVYMGADNVRVSSF